MSSYGMLYIVPNEDKIVGDVFTRRVKEKHLDGLNEFSAYYNLGHQFVDEEYQNACYILALEGNLVVKTVDDVVNLIMLVPPIVTDNQDMWLHSNKEMLEKYTFAGAYFMENNEKEYKEVTGVDNIIRIADIKNMKYEKGEKTNAR